MVQPVTAILSGASELAAAARMFTHDTNEASLLVGRVVSRAFGAFEAGVSDEVIRRAMRRDLDRMIEQRQRAPHA
jgi:predicted GNAT family N-acyltransferase